MHEAKRTEHSETECSVTEHRFFEQLLRRASLNDSVAWVSTENALILAQGVDGALVQDPCRFSSAWLELSAQGKKWSAPLAQYISNAILLCSSFPVNSTASDKATDFLCLPQQSRQEALPPLGVKLGSGWTLAV